MKQKISANILDENKHVRGKKSSENILIFEGFMGKSRPEVFIIESLGLDDETGNLFEGRILSQILHLSGKKSIYYYVRTKAEFKIMLSEFKKSRYRYLHLSCHGSKDAIHTTIDEIPFDELKDMLCPVLDKRRLFLSACSMANKNLAQKIFLNSECLSVVGPKSDIEFNDAAIMWASFYHLMFKSNPVAMKHVIVEKNMQSVVSMFNVPMRYYRKNKKKLFIPTLIKPEKKRGKITKL
jgi:hypothetical protein